MKEAKNNNGILKWSNDYRQFKLMVDRRPLDKSHLANIIESMAKRGYIAVFPILVTSSGVVWDGNHRLAAAEKLGIDYCYAVVDTKEGLDEAIILADTTKKWTFVDYLHRYVVQGKVNYLAIQDLLDRRPYLTLSMVVNLARAPWRSGAKEPLTNGQAWRNGTYVANDIQFLEKVCDLAEFCHACGAPAALRNMHIRALHNLCSNIEFDEVLFRGKVEKLAYLITPRPTVEDYMLIFNEIYNYKTHYQNRAYFNKISYNSAQHRARAYKRTIKEK